MIAPNVPSARADVVVLSNRTASQITVTLLPAQERSRPLAIASGDSRCVFFESSLHVRYQEGLARRVHILNAGNAYFFGQRPQEKTLVFEKIGLGETLTDTRAVPPHSFVKRIPGSDTIDVKILVDDNEATHRRIWEPRIRKRIAAASEVLHRHCGMRLKVVAVATWNSDDAQHDFLRSLREFEQEVFAKPGQVAIGFSSQYRITHGRTHMGGTRGPLHSHILLKERSPQIRETERLELLLHELGHYLGASHSPEPTSAMRPVLSGGLQRRLGARVQFDPVNTLLMGLMAEEIRQQNIRQLTDLRPATRRRMRQIYQVLETALPEDPAAGIYLRLIGNTTSPPLLDGTAKILRHLVQVAQKVQIAQKKDAEKNIQADALTNLYVQQAALVAGQLKPKHSAKALLLALGVFVDDSNDLLQMPMASALVRRVENPQQRRARIAALGAPTMRTRHDLAKHFFVSAHLVVTFGAPAARTIGLAKELKDAQHGTGFSFADMAANRAGIVFAERLLAGEISLVQIAQKFQVEDYLPPIDDLAEGIGAARLKLLYGTDAAESLGAKLLRIERRVLELPVYR